MTLIQTYEMEMEKRLWTILVNKRARSLGSLSSVFLIELNEPSGRACSVS